AHDEAVGYYGQALELLCGGNRDEDPGLLLELLTRLGEAQRRAGEAIYRGTLLEACSLARRLGDTDGLVRAALANTRGVHSAAGEVDRERVEALEAAAAALGPADRPERARVLATLASELAFSGEWERRRRLSDEALAVARRVGDDATLVRVLNMRGFVLLVPETARQRLTETAEALEVADRVGDPLERYFALWMRRLVTVQVCDFEAAERVLAEQERLAEQLGQPILRWYAMAHRAWSEAFVGHLGAAERLAQEALDLGTEIGDPDAAPVHAAALFMIRFDQGRLKELEPQLTHVVATSPGISTFRALLALTCCELGRNDEARRLVTLDAATAFAEIPYDCDWAACLAAYAYVSSHLGDRHTAEVLYARLRPASGLLADAVAFALGAMDHHLATLAATLSRFEDAERHFAAAAETHRRIPARSWLARTQLEWARMLLTRRGPGDDERARERLGQALATAQELGLPNVERDAVTLLQECP
ncbi:MAG: hypothetical protein LC792_02120, partial [Actinobacteria bacterium]|nr:hypothetical protein [Actinomycetota bacterium]